MDNDDRQIGRILSRREVLALLGAAGTAVLVGCGPSSSGTSATAASGGAAAAPTLNAEAATVVAQAGNPTAQATAAAEVATAEVANTAVAGESGGAAPACVVRPEVTEGPYYVAEGLVRSDIRSDPSTGTVKAGAPLVLTFNVSQVSNSACAPLQGATVEIWHCDAAGQYSDVSDPGFDTKGQKWLRGAQVTDASGAATFTTIYPGWYSGRAVHIHFKVHPDETKVFTSQLFFDDALSQQVFAQAPYASKGSTPDTLNSTDNIYQDLLLLTTTKTDQGYAATFAIGIDPTTVGTGQSGGGPGGGPGIPPPVRAPQQSGG
ncbi:MAG: intradiol ring-cleavage dioxygenase [Kouleothrix sp.]|nr:intradiol ring-cleavage dioxygenase [Kouleothrix sp.]